MSAPLVFITGASSGIGQALAARYARAGWRLALVARRVAELQAWADAQGLTAERVGIYRADVADIDSIVAAGTDCIARQGQTLHAVTHDGRPVCFRTIEKALTTLADVTHLDPEIVVDSSNWREEVGPH